MGGYLRPSTNVELTAVVSFRDREGTTRSKEVSRKIPSGKWSKFGVHDIFPMKEMGSVEGDLVGSIRIHCDEDDPCFVDFYGVEMNVVAYYFEKDLWYRFSQKTGIYFPEIYYFESSKAFEVLPSDSAAHDLIGRCLVLKSCNRCTRYLPIDLENERNTISFSNHHRKKQCNHASFATYRITQNSCEELPEFISRKIVDKTEQPTLEGRPSAAAAVRTFYGYQLECRPCKKFVVNAPLNPKRSSTQHREDSLRRRAFEGLVDHLLERDTIYNEWKAKQMGDFDEFIWNKFGRKCFHCGRELKTPNSMALDHTLPLSALWRLDETATCLCKTCNSEKRDKFPKEYYRADELIQLSRITDLELKLLESKPINQKVVQKLNSGVVWFFDKFLKHRDYQKVRKGKRTADLIYKSIQQAVDLSQTPFDLVREYHAKIGKFPRTVTLVSS